MKPTKSQLDQIKRQVDRFEVYLDNYDRADHDELITRLETISPLYSQYTDVHSQLTDCGKLHDVKELESFEASYFKAVAFARKIITKQERDASFNASGVAVALGSQAPIKLPTINLPVFGGAYEDWMGFRDSFQTLIHDSPSLTDAQKLHYLKSCLKQDAARVIHSLQTTNINYAVAWDLLKQRYENKRLIIHNHIKAIMNIPQLHKEKHAELRDLCDRVQKHLRALEALGLPVQYWDALIIHITASKLDSTTARDWELVQLKDELPAINEFFDFLSKRCYMLESVASESKMKQPNTKSFVTAESHTKKCALCNEAHQIYSCAAFQELAVPKRIVEAKRLKLCLNCLKKGHLRNECKSNFSCRKCQKGHNSLLHLEAYNNARAPVSSATITSANETTICNVAATKGVLLGTAVVNVYSNSGKMHKCRALLDSASQSNFITEDLCKLLDLRQTNVNISVSGISDINSKINKRVTVRCQSVHNMYTASMHCLVIKRITDDMPAESFHREFLNIPDDIVLADPQFNETGAIDLLIGAGIFWNIFSQGQIKLGRNMPILQKTQLGWIISGPLPLHSNNKQANHVCCLSKLEQLNAQMGRFWEIEEGSDNTFRSATEDQCELNYKQTTQRLPDGRFSVAIPFTGRENELGDSKESAIRRFAALERKFSRDKKLKDEYTKFMKEYEQLGHMSKITTQAQTQPSYYLPHHAVIKQTSITTKLRVVFDGSARTTSGLSLNDVQLVGPTIQQDLFTIILRMRGHRYVVTGDIEKMYRQVEIQEQNRDFQRILWRPEATQPLQSYALNTVTYGTASASFLAIRCLHELAHEFKNSYPEACSVILEDFYVDDLITGCNDISKLIQVKMQIDTILKSGGFNLRKWVSNDKRIIQDSINPEANLITFEKSVKTLGLFWDPMSDNLGYSGEQEKRVITKRGILATIAQIFDPLGLIGPITISAKIIMQRLWQLKISWDESVPLDIHTTWASFQQNLLQLDSIKVPRHVACNGAARAELHGFCDASEQAYGACVYVKTIDGISRPKVQLLCAKSRVAPLKTITIPRLELCGALMLAKLVLKVTKSMRMTFESAYFWCDSQITLTWIKSPPNQWKTFVANRVSEIQSNTNAADWRHVKTGDNPADIISRGMKPQDLRTSSLWWHGPAWLSEPQARWPAQAIQCRHDKIPEIKSITLLATTEEFTLYSRFSTFSKLNRVAAYCLRFVSNCRVDRENRETGVLSTIEIRNAVHALIKNVQGQAFPREIKNLKSSCVLHTKSSILALCPFLDEQGLMRVGGRLKLSEFTRDKKHPILLPKAHSLTKLIAKSEHIKLLHAGPETVLASLRERYWPISGRNLLKQITRNCVRCFRSDPKPGASIMGELPALRVAPAKPFSTCGVDYAGPFKLRDRKGRGCKVTKSYLCIFVCFITKAMHLELVGDLTTDSFMAALRRFAARRGLPHTIYSDNGTNFVGANRELKELFNLIMSNKTNIMENASQMGVTWNFIPARSPHFGGLWEAGVKSVKTQLKRILGECALTYEEFVTVLNQIESCLNSRPLTPLSSDPHDLQPLTPAHFLIGERLTALPDEELLPIKESRLSRFQRVQQLHQSFWKRWSREYISTLQQRSKWKRPSKAAVAPGDLVLIQEDNTPPSHWPLGRIQELHPGADGVVRVVTVRTNKGSFKRAIVKVCALPKEDDFST